MKSNPLLWDHTSTKIPDVLKKSQIIFCMKIDFDLRNADDVQWTRKRSLPRQQIGGSSLLIGRLKRSTLFIGLAIMYHVSSFLYSILMGLLSRP